MSSHRILIAGSGVIGLACAASLARNAALSKHQFLVLGDVPEKFDVENDYGRRVYALNAATRRLLSAIGVWERIEELRAFPYEAMYVYDDGARLDFHATDIGASELGFIAEDALLRHVLFEHLLKQSNVEMLCPERLRNLTTTQDGCEAMLSNDDTIEADLVIGADGAQSYIRSQAGIHWQHNDYAQSAIVATIKLEDSARNNRRNSHKNSCWQWFHRDSILAFLPLTEDRLSIVWSCDQALADALMSSSPQDFLTRLSEYSNGSLSQLALASERKMFPLSGGVAKTYVADGIVLVGDAAHCVHPLAGQGANLGFADVNCLSRVLSDGGISRLALRRYAREMKSRNLLMKYSLDQIKALFAAEEKAVRALCRTGLRFVNHCMPLKSRLIRYAEG